MWNVVMIELSMQICYLKYADVLFWHHLPQTWKVLTLFNSIHWYVFSEILKITKMHIEAA